MSSLPANPFDAMLAIEEMLHARRPIPALEAMTALVSALQGRYFLHNFCSPTDPGNPYPLHGGLCERFAQAWGALVLDESLDIERAPIGGMLRNLHVVHELVHGTAQGNLDHCLHMLGRRTGGNYNAPSLVRLLLLWVPGSRVPLDFARMHRVMPELVTAAAVATLANLVASTPEAHRSREAAIVFLNSGVPKAADYQRIGLSQALQTAWMFCSYACAADKHGIKRLLNEVIEQLPRDGVDVAALPQRETGGRPVMVVPLEHFQSTHAMYRCYAPVIEACREHFFLVGLATSGSVDDTARALFDAFHFVDLECGENGAVHPDKVEALVKSYAPAIVFYPSIGMRSFVLVLANRRLAPVQAMTYGHPATSGSRHIDYGLTEVQWVIDPACFTEKIIPLPRGTLRYVMHAQAGVAPPPARHNGNVLRIAVPSYAQKWTWPFLEALGRVRARAGQQVEFHFFSGVNGYTYPSAVNAVLRALPNAIVHPSLPYPAYIDALSRCDVHAATFPFGGTNSVFDSLSCGLPVVCLAAREIHGAQDGDFLQRAGLPAWLVAKDVDGFVDNLVRLAQEPALLAELQGLLADRDRIRDIFVEGGDPAAFAAALAGIAGVDSRARS